MRIKAIEIKDYNPIKYLKIENMGSIVIIAGANGAGKTRLKQALVNTLQGTPEMSLEIEATRPEELADFQGNSINVIQGTTNSILNSYVGSRRYGRGNYVGSLVQIDSQRDIQTLKYNQVAWNVEDPDDTDTPSTYYYNPFRNRWQDFMNYIHNKVGAHDTKISAEVVKNPDLKGTDYISMHPHPMDKYKKIFSQLLQGKELQDISLSQPGEFKYKDINGSILSFSTLSSGEQEVIKVLFDVLRKDIKHSTIVVDEPELHLHPTLAFKLIETLKLIGEQTNQYIFLTHSADLISTYYSTGDVYFIDAEQTGSNQAHRLSDLNHSHRALVELIGENLGLFAVGKKLVFVEGEASSIDRLTYHAIAQKCLPEAKIVQVGSVENIVTLNTIEEQIRNSIFGINLYMIRDRDGLTLPQIQKIEEKGRVKCLAKRHLENYFLDPEVLHKVAVRLCLTTLYPELTPDYISKEIGTIAKSTAGYTLLQNMKDFLSVNSRFNIPTVKEVDSKTIQEIKNEIISGIKDSLNNLGSSLDEAKINQWLTEEEGKINSSLSNNTWIETFQGKLIFSKVCSNILHEDPIKIRQAYVEIALETKPDVFKDITDTMTSFN